MGRVPLCGVLAVMAVGCDTGGESHQDNKVAFITEPAREGSPLPATDLTVDDFRFIGAGTTMQDVTARVGEPGRDIGSGIHIYLYRLKDETLMWIGSADGSGILYVRHVGRLAQESTTLYERRRD